MSSLRRLLLLDVFSCFLSYIQAEDGSSSGGCDSTSIDSNVPVSSLTPNTFHKICPKTTSKPFGQPICGDGSSFSFFLSRPPQSKQNDEKILIEFLGGGACWDSTTCGKMVNYLTFPPQLNNFVGLSCSEIQTGSQGNYNNDKFPINMLCAETVGGVDFTAYNTIVIPYCTQDVHTGDAVMTYDDGSIVRHAGAHNMMSVLRYIFANFKNLKHIALTGCSAGGTVLPVAYDLLNKHYNRFGTRSVQINVIADTPTYLTPTYFLTNGLGNWNPWPIMKRIGFNYEKWRYSEEYPTATWDHVLKRGSNRDQWGFTSHTNDPTSQTYFQWMSGNGDNQRWLEDGNDNAATWWSELSNSLAIIQNKHANVKTYFIEEERHCSFGLYYPLQQDGFEEWAGSIFAESRVLGHTSSAVPLFVLSVVFGSLFAAGAVYSRKQQQRIDHVDDGDFLKYNNDEDDTRASIRAKLFGVLGRFHSYPLTLGYALAVTFYFLVMMIREGFAHPINNPSLGPSAVALNSYGINNPSLIVYKTQIFRLITSSFLCSGMLTYITAVISLWCFVKPLEETIKSLNFGVLCGILMLGTNLTYALFANGASCSSMALILGLMTFSIMVRRQMNEGICMITFTTIFFALLLSLVFTFNSWFMVVVAIVLGVICSQVLFELPENSSEEAVHSFFATASADVSEVHKASQDSLHSACANDDDVSEEVRKESPEFKLKQTPLYSVAGFYGVMFLLLLFRLRRPNKLYLQPFYTGCNLQYSDGIDDLAASYYNGGEGNGERLLDDEDGAYQNLCAQFCVPHLASKGVMFGAKRFGLPITSGTCEGNGFDEHLADKTFKYATYSLDVEIYTQSGYEDRSDD
jgi:membrane associated rhomboid family serine protease